MGAITGREPRHWHDPSGSHRGLPSAFWGEQNLSDYLAHIRAHERQREQLRERGVDPREFKG
jgi:hypothetical protein